jgi:hypothetical protein
MVNASLALAGQLTKTNQDELQFKETKVQSTKNNKGGQP